LFATSSPPCTSDVRMCASSTRCQHSTTSKQRPGQPQPMSCCRQHTLHNNVTCAHCAYVGKTYGRKLEKAGPSPTTEAMRRNSPQSKELRYPQWFKKRRSEALRSFLCLRRQGSKEHNHQHVCFKLDHQGRRKSHSLDKTGAAPFNGVLHELCGKAISIGILACHHRRQA